MSEINLDDFGRCEYDADSCGRPATVLTDEGYRWCHEHAELWADSVVALDSPDPREGAELPSGRRIRQGG